jgi:hypothetical protein
VFIGHCSCIWKHKIRAHLYVFPCNCVTVHYHILLSQFSPNNYCNLLTEVGIVTFHCCFLHQTVHFDNLNQFTTIIVLWILSYIICITIPKLGSIIICKIAFIELKCYEKDACTSIIKILLLISDNIIKQRLKIMINTFWQIIAIFPLISTYTVLVWIGIYVM